MKIVLLQICMSLFLIGFVCGDDTMLSTCRVPQSLCKDKIFYKNCHCEEIASLLQYAMNLLHCSGGVMVNGICYKLPYVVGRRLTLGDASNLCLFHGGKLAPVKTKEVYDAIFDYVKATWNYDPDFPDLNRIGIWIGLTYQSGKSVTLSGDVGYTEWKNGYPKPDTSYTRIAVTVPISPKCSTSLYGMWNTRTNDKNIPICQMWDE